MKKITGAKTALERNVQTWLNERAVEYDGNMESVLSDLLEHGCVSGQVGHLIYYKDTLAFFKKHKKEINELIKEILSDTGETISQMFRDFDNDDPLCMDTNNQNLLAWFAFEETARKLADRNGIEV